MNTSEILELYKLRWTEINNAGRFGNITVTRMHTALLMLSAQTIGALAERLIQLENTTSVTVLGGGDNTPKKDYKTQVDMIMKQSNIKHK